jgi:ABC-2 type transport system ATP-binding protein
MNPIATNGLGKRYGKRWVLADCTLSIPQGRVVGLVGANGAGKTTLLHLAVGLLEPSAGTIEVLGGTPAASAAQLARVGFLAQDAPVETALTVGEHLRFGARCNPRWDGEFALRRIERLGLDLRQRAGRLSGGQRSQLALTLAMAKRPELLVLDEPVASLDPLARREFLGELMELVATHGPTVVISSHVIADVERVCDHLVVMAHGRVRVAGDGDDLLARHKFLTSRRRDAHDHMCGQDVVHVSHTERQTTALVRLSGPVLDPNVAMADVGVEDLVLGYMAIGAPPTAASPELEVVHP